MLQTERIGQGARNVRHDERPDRRTAGLREAIPPGLCGIRNASPLEQARTWRANAGGCPGSGARLAHRGQPRSAAVGGTDRTGLPCHSLRNDATITSHCLWWRCGAGTPACWVETHLDPLRERHPPSRSAEKSLGAADTSVCATSWLRSISPTVRNHRRHVRALQQETKSVAIGCEIRLGAVKK